MLKAHTSVIAQFDMNWANDRLSSTLHKQLPWIDDSIVLCSIPKSGTVYIKTLLANYFYLMFIGGNDGVDYHTMQKTLFPNHINLKIKLDKRSMPNYIESLSCPCHKIFDNTVYKDLITMHMCDAIDNFTSRKTIFLYRHPLDMILSATHYFEESPDVFSEGAFGAYVDKWIDIYAIMIRAMIRKKKENKNSIIVSYEDIRKNTPLFTKRIIEFLEIPLDMEKMLRAIELSAFDRMREFEESNGPIHGTRAPYFVRSGKIGQWKEAMPERLAKAALQKLNAYGLQWRTD